MKKHLSFICCAMLATTMALYGCSNSTLNNDTRSADSTAAAADALAMQLALQPAATPLAKAVLEKKVPPPPTKATPLAKEKLPTHKVAKKPSIVRGPATAIPKPRVTAPLPPAVQEAHKQAILGYSFFKHVERGTTRYVHAYITVSNPAGKVRDTLRQLNIDDQLEKGNDTSSIYTTNMQLYNYVTLTLVSADSSFKILPVTDQARQQVDIVNGNHWEWAITAIGDMPKGILVLKVDAEKPGGGIENLAPRSIPIKIDIDVNIFRSVWIYMGDNPSVVLTAILIPLIAYFGKRYLDGKKKAAA